MTILTPAEAARILRISTDEVTAMLRGGGLPGFRLGRLWRIPEDALAEWVRAAVDSRHGQEAPRERQRDGHRLPASRPPAAVAGGARRRVDGRRKADPPQPLRVVGAGGAGHAR